MLGTPIQKFFWRFSWARCLSHHETYSVRRKLKFTKDRSQLLQTNPHNAMVTPIMLYTTANAQCASCQWLQVKMIHCTSSFLDPETDFQEKDTAFVILALTKSHRLHESASHVLTATHHSNGRFCDFLLFFSNFILPCLTGFTFLNNKCCKCVN